MFKKLKFAYLNHRNRVNLLKTNKYFKCLYESTKYIFKLLIIFNICSNILLFINIGKLGILNLVFLIFIVLLIPIYYNFIKLLVYSIIWASKYFEIEVEINTEFDT